MFSSNKIIDRRAYFTKCFPYIEIWAYCEEKNAQSTYSLTFFVLVTLTSVENNFIINQLMSRNSNCGKFFTCKTIVSYFRMV